MDKISPRSWRMRLAFPFRPTWELPNFVSNCQLFWRSLFNLSVAATAATLVFVVYYHLHDVLVLFGILLLSALFYVALFSVVHVTIWTVGTVGSKVVKRLPSCKTYMVEDEDTHV